MKIENKDLLNEGKVLIDFWAPWCGPCKVMKPMVEKFADSTDGVNVYFCNIDEDYEMASAFGIRSIPTLVYMEDGEVKDRKVGSVQQNVLKEMVNV
jgi:thioredoxin 1